MIKPGGIILLSGILREQAEEVISAYEKWISFSPPLYQADWVRLDGIRKN